MLPCLLLFETVSAAMNRTGTTYPACKQKSAAPFGVPWHG